MAARMLRLCAGVGAVLLAASTVAATPAEYEPGVDPAVGFNLISWWNFGASGAATWEGAVQDVYDHGFRSVSVSPVRFVNTGTGEIRLSDGTTTGPDTSHIAAAIARARTLGMSVTVNPFVEPDGFASWRGSFNPSGARKAQFWADYETYLVEIAQAAEANGADRMTVGTELKAIVQNSGHNANWAQVIDAVDATFSGQLGYAANWDNYENSNLTATLWENAKIDFMGVDTYHPLTSSPEASGLGQPALSLLVTRWQSVLTNPAGGFAHGILTYAAVRKGGVGMPVVLTEHGTVPYDKTTTKPYDAWVSSTPDVQEQRDDYDALMQAADGRAASALSDGRLDEIHLWHWGMPGAAGSRYFLDPEGDDIVDGAQAAQFLEAFVATAPSPDVPALGRAGLLLVAFLLVSPVLASRAVRRNAGRPR